MQQNPQNPPLAELKKVQKRLSLIPPVGVALLLLAEVFMVAAAQFWAKTPRVKTKKESVDYFA